MTLENSARKETKYRRIICVLQAQHLETCKIVLKFQISWSVARFWHFGPRGTELPVVSQLVVIRVGYCNMMALSEPDTSPSKQM
jgi:hypothetical protein